jgi:transcriptional regulator with XRE-family HTH domain
VGTPLGEFIRAKRDKTRPADLGLPDGQRRRAPGLRRTELAARAGISVEYLTRIEQGRDRNPSGPVVNAIADALGLDVAERRHLSYLAKISGGACAGPHRREPPARHVRPEVLRVLQLLEPAAAMVTNRLGQHLPPSRGQLRMRHPAVEHELRWDRETLELPAPDEQQLVVYLPADEQTTRALGRLRHGNQPRLRVI